MTGSKVPLVIQLRNLPQLEKLHYLALLIFIATAWFSIGHNKSDEHYQILEFAQYQMGHISAEELPWEFEEQMRPTVQPWFVVAVVTAFKAVNITNPFVITKILRLLTALLFWFLIRRLNGLLIKKYFPDSRWALLFTCCTFFLWFVPFLSVRFSSESYANLFLCTGLYLVLKDSKQLLNIALTGVCLALTILVKAQMGLAVVGIFAWLFFESKAHRVTLFKMLPAFILIILAGIYLDTLFYETPVFTPYNFIESNIEGGKADQYGVLPFYYYLLGFIMATIPPLSIALGVAFFYALFLLKRNLVVWAIVPFILIHSGIGHKEIRFLIPIYYLVIFLSIYGISQYFKTRAVQKYQRIILKVAVVLNAIVLTYMIFKPANGKVLYQQYLYEHLDDANRTIVTTEKDYYQIMGGLQTTFYRPKNISSYAVETPEDVGAFLTENKIDTCYYIHRKMAYKGSIIGYDMKKVFGLYPDFIDSLDFVDTSKIRTDCIYLVTKK